MTDINYESRHNNAAIAIVLCCCLGEVYIDEVLVCKVSISFSIV